MNAQEAPSTSRQRYLLADGTLVGERPGCAGDETLVTAYRAMVRTRTFDEKAVALQRTGRLGTYASSLGQEAVGIGIGLAMQAADVLLPSFRDHGAQLLRGVTMEELLLYWGGDERGSDFAGPREDFPVCIPVASQFPHAVGVALAFTLRRQNRVAVAIGGDGSTSKGDFYEALNGIGAWHLPAVFVVVDNGWAISMPRAEQSATETLAQKALAAGIPGEQVDGNDIIAVLDAMTRALDRARTGGGPGLVECLTYRLADHTTADDASRYREPDEVSRRWKEEPISRLRTWLAEADLWSSDDERALLEAAGAKVDAAAERYLATPPQHPRSLFTHLHADLPDDLAGQLAEATIIADDPDA